MCLRQTALSCNLYCCTSDGRVFASGDCASGLLGRPCTLDLEYRHEYSIGGVKKNLTLPFSSGFNATLAQVPGLPEVSWISGGHTGYAIDTGLHRTVWQWGSCSSSACYITSTNISFPSYTYEDAIMRDSKRSLIPSPRFDMWSTTLIQNTDLGYFQVGGERGVGPF